MKKMYLKMKVVIQMTVLYSVLILIMLISGIAALVFDNLLNSIIAAGLVSLIAAALFYFLKAPDVAMTEAAIGAGLTTAIFVITLRKTEGSENEWDLEIYWP